MLISTTTSPAIGSVNDTSKLALIRANAGCDARFPKHPKAALAAPTVMSVISSFHCFRYDLRLSTTQVLGDFSMAYTDISSRSPHHLLGYVLSQALDPRKELASTIRLRH